MSAEVFKFAHEHPYIACFLVCVVCFLVSGIINQVVFRVPNRFIRHLNIRKHGWPPRHCDADGDAVDVEDDE